MRFFLCKDKYYKEIIFILINKMQNKMFDCLLWLWSVNVKLLNQIQLYSYLIYFNILSFKIFINQLDIFLTKWLESKNQNHPILFFILKKYRLTFILSHPLLYSTYYCTVVPLSPTLPIALLISFSLSPALCRPLFTSRLLNTLQTLFLSL